MKLRSMDEMKHNSSSETLCADLPLDLTVSVGWARPRVRDLMEARPGAIIPLSGNVDDPVCLYVGEQLVAKGELIELDGDNAGKLAVKLIDVVKTVERPNGND